MVSQGFGCAVRGADAGALDAEGEDDLPDDVLPADELDGDGLVDVVRVVAAFGSPL